MASKLSKMSLMRHSVRHFSHSKLQVGSTSVRLSSGLDMPLIALGTWKSEPELTKQAIETAIDCGYTNLDTANDYNNEHEIGNALRDLFSSGRVQRQDLFIQSKLWNSNHRVEHIMTDLQQTLDDLQVDYLDSWVIHWPQAAPATGKDATTRLTGAYPDHYSKNTMFPIDDNGYFCSDNDHHFIDTYLFMEELIDQGLVKSIGLSNFNRRQIEEVLNNYQKYHPSVLQNECHPYLQQKDLVDYCRINDIQFQAFSALGSGATHMGDSGVPPSGVIALQDPLILELAKKYNRTPAQIILRWNVQRGVAVVTKSVNPQRIVDNYQIFDFELSSEDMRSFDRINYGWRHLLWTETSSHPDYPFHDELGFNYTLKKAPTVSSSGTQA